MATVRYFPSDGAQVLVALHKPVTTVGRALGNDIHLPDASVASHHVQIVFNGRDFQLEEVDREAEILRSYQQSVITGRQPSPQRCCSHIKGI